MTRRNVPLWLLFTLSQYTPLYWPYMFHLVTVIRGLSAAEFGVLKGLYYLVAIAAEVPAGIAADRLSRRGAMLLGAFVNGAACLVYTQAQGFEAFALGEALFGVGTALVSGADSALLYDSLAQDGRKNDYLRLAGRGRMLGLLGTAAALPFCDAFLIRDGDPTLTYTVTAGIAWVGVLAAVLLREPPRGSQPSASVITRGALRELAKSRVLAALLVYTTGCFLLMRASNALFYNPILLEKGIEVTRYGAVLAGTGLVGALFAWRIDRIYSRIGSRGTLAAIPLLLIGMYAGLMGVDAPIAVGLFFIAGAVSGVLDPVGHHLLNQLASSSDHRATLLSVQSVCWRGGYAGASVLLGWTLEWYSLPAAVAALLALSGVLLIPSFPLLLRAFAR